MMVNAMRSKGRPFEYLLFKCEQCGFRIAENIKRALDAGLHNETVAFRSVDGDLSASMRQRITAGRSSG